MAKLKMIPLESHYNTVCVCLQSATYCRRNESHSNDCWTFRMRHFLSSLFIVRSGSKFIKTFIRQTRMYEIPRYSIHCITILLAKYKSLNYFILEKTFHGIRFKIDCMPD